MSSKARLPRHLQKKNAKEKKNKQNSENGLSISSQIHIPTRKLKNISVFVDLTEIDESFSMKEVNEIFNEVKLYLPYEKTGIEYYNEALTYIEQIYKMTYSHRTYFCENNGRVLENKYFQGDNAWKSHFCRYPNHNHGYISYVDNTWGAIQLIEKTKKLLTCAIINGCFDAMIEYVYIYFNMLKHDVWITKRYCKDFIRLLLYVKFQSSLVNGVIRKLEHIKRICDEIENEDLNDYEIGQCERYSSEFE